MILLLGGYTELLKIFKVEGDIINQMILPSSLSIPCLAVFIIIKMAVYCPQGSGTLRQQLLIMH